MHHSPLMNTLVACAKCEKLNRVPLEKSASTTPICGNCKAELPLNDHVQEVSANGLAQLIRAADQPVIVDFWAEWCGPCKTFAPTFRDAARELGTQMIFAKLNTQNYPQIAQKYHIRGIPTLIVFKKGVEIDRQSGAMPLPMFMQYLARWK